MAAHSVVVSLCLNQSELYLSRIFSNMGKIRLALVHFTGDPKKYVVNVNGFVEFGRQFKPRHENDFDGSKVFEVNWPVLQNEGSSTTEKPFPAKILCLGGKFMLLHNFSFVRD